MDNNLKAKESILLPIFSQKMTECTFTWTIFGTFLTKNRQILIL